MTTLKNNEKNYLKTSMSNTQILIPAAGPPPKSIRKIDKFIAKNYPVSLIKINDKSTLFLLRYDSITDLCYWNNFSQG